jgi:hypothetical protein
VLAPYLIYLNIFMYYAFWIVGGKKLGEDRVYDDEKNKNTVVFLVIFSIYFIVHEFR